MTYGSENCRYACVRAPRNLGPRQNPWPKVPERGAHTGLRVAKPPQGQTAAAPVAGATRPFILQSLGPRSLLFSKDRDKRQSASGSIGIQPIEAIQEVGIDLLNGPGERSRQRNVIPVAADSHSDALRHPKMRSFFYRKVRYHVATVAKNVKPTVRGPSAMHDRCVGHVGASF